MGMPSNLAVIWFTCGRDAELLKLSTQSVQNRVPDAKLYAYEDLKDPLPESFLWAGTRRTGGEHGNGLDSLKCIVRQIEAMQEVAEETGAEWLLKIDSDMLWLSTRRICDKLDGYYAVMGSDSMGAIAGRWRYCSGGAYFVNAHALRLAFPPDESIEKKIRRMDMMTGFAWSKRWHEDQVITTIIPFFSGMKRFGVPFGEGGLQCYNFLAQESCHADFVEFGRRSQLGAIAPAAKTVLQKIAMSKYLS
jgi:hypothetical protein